MGQLYRQWRRRLQRLHSFPEFLEKGNAAGSNPAVGDPFEGTPLPRRRADLDSHVNISHYRRRRFGPLMTRNLTRDPSGRPEGLTEREFITVMRTGEDIDCAKFPADPICALLPEVAFNTLTLLHRCYIGDKSRLRQFAIPPRSNGPTVPAIAPNEGGV